MLGISANYSTGDSGDFTFDFPGATPTVSAPADSPYATAIGGVTVALNRNKTIAFQTGWGNNETLLIESGTIFDAPFNLGFLGGSGGGPSAFFSKPSFQSSLPGGSASSRTSPGLPTRSPVVLSPSPRRLVFRRSSTRSGEAPASLVRCSPRCGP